MGAQKRARVGREGSGDFIDAVAPLCVARCLSECPGRQLFVGTREIEMKTAKTTKITVLIGDDHSIVRQGLTSLLEAGGDVDVVGEAADGEEVLRKAAKLQPNVVVLDLAMPVLNGVETTRRLATRTPSAKIIILSSYSEAEEVERALEAGALSYVMKETASAEVLKAVREAHHGRAYLSAPISQRLQQDNRSAYMRGGNVKNPSRNLTPRELEVLKLVCVGKANKQIADDLQISIKTVEKHRQSLMDKLNIHETAGLTRYAAAHGLIDQDRPSVATRP
jgi:DNA-binding NarL/FixJ family response regulator